RRHYLLYVDRDLFATDVYLKSPAVAHVAVVAYVASCMQRSFGWQRPSVRSSDAAEHPVVRPAGARGGPEAQSTAPRLRGALMMQEADSAVLVDHIVYCCSSTAPRTGHREAKARRETRLGTSTTAAHPPEPRTSRCIALRLSFLCGNTLPSAGLRY